MRRCLGVAGLRCGALISRGTRCLACARLYDRSRRPSPTVRYGSGYQSRHAAALVDEPWCHWPGCPYPITPANPLTADHSVPAARGGMGSVLVPMCKHHNSSRGARGGVPST